MSEKQKFKILLIRPQLGYGQGGRYNSPARMQPLALAVLAALTPRDIELKAIDERFEKIPFHENFDLVALSVCTFSARRAYDIADAFRRRGTPVVMGGFHPTLQPDEAQEHADVVAIGDAEHSWPQIIEDARCGRLQARYQPSEPGPATGVTPDRSIFDGKWYFPLKPVQFGRGCTRSCEFCSIRAFYQGCIRYREVDEVVAELKALDSRKVFFVDDNLIAHRGRFKELLLAIQPLGLRWSSQLDISLADDEELLELAARSGCQTLIIGFESLNEANLAQMGKQWNRVDQYSQRLAKIRRAGIMVYGTFVFGYDADTPETIARTLDFALQEKMAVANFNPLQALPGTPLYERMRSENRLVFSKWWLDESYRWHDALLAPKGMTAAALTDGCALAREAFHSMKNIFARLCDRQANARNLANILFFLSVNIASRIDIKLKTGMSFSRKIGTRTKAALRHGVG